jgi:hypothetical protein
LTNTKKNRKTLELYARSKRLVEHWEEEHHGPPWGRKVTKEFVKSG